MHKYVAIKLEKSRGQLQSLLIYCARVLEKITVTPPKLSYTSCHSPKAWPIYSTGGSNASRACCFVIPLDSHPFQHLRKPGLEQRQPWSESCCTMSVPDTDPTYTAVMDISTQYMQTYCGSSPEAAASTLARLPVCSTPPCSCCCHSNCRVLAAGSLPLLVAVLSMMGHGDPRHHRNKEITDAWMLHAPEAGGAW